VKEKYSKAIQLGKIWMKNSLNTSHGYEHAKFVEENAVNIYRSLKKEGIYLNGVNKKLVRIVSWWHDAYKARLKRPEILSFFFEGFCSSKIVERELKKYLSVKDLKTISKAIKYHHIPIYYYIMKWRHPILSQILIEADGLEDLNLDRKEMQINSFRNPLLRIMYRINNRFMIFLLSRIAVSKYTKDVLRKVMGV